jgi:hypothetical protein
MTGEYTFVTAERQNELTRRIQEQLAAQTKKDEPRQNSTGASEPGVPPIHTISISALVQ